MGRPPPRFGRLSSEESSPASESLACSLMGDLRAAHFIAEAEFLCLLNGYNLDLKSYDEG